MGQSRASEEKNPLALRRIQRSNKKGSKEERSFLSIKKATHERETFGPVKQENRKSNPL